MRAYDVDEYLGMEVVEVRKNFPRLQILGGIDKRAVAAGKEAIDAELEARLPFMLPRGGYIPYVDHLVPSDVPWKNFVYYRRQVEAMAKQYGSGSLA